MRIWMFNCRHVAQLVSESMDHKLSLSRRLGVRFHLLMCRHCARYGEQLRFIRRLIRNQLSSPIDPSLTLDESAKKRLRQIIVKSSKNKE